MLSTKPVPVNVRCLYGLPELLSQAGFWGRNLYYCNHTWENSRGQEELEDKSLVSKIFVLASDLKGQSPPWGQRWTQGNLFLPWRWEERRDTHRQNAPVFRSRVPRRKAVSFSSSRNWPASSWGLDQKPGKEHCCSPQCVLENLILPKAALILFFWTSPQTLPHRNPARANAEISTTLISLGQSSMAVETRQRDQWQRPHRSQAAMLNSKEEKTDFLCSPA